jgi:hypothetical protein
MSNVYAVTSGNCTATPNITDVIIKQSTSPVTITLPKITSATKSLSVGNFGCHDFYLQAAQGDTISGCTMSQVAVKMLTIVPSSSNTWSVLGTAATLDNSVLLQYYSVPATNYTIRSEEVLTVPASVGEVTVTFPRQTKWLLTKIT